MSPWQELLNAQFKGGELEIRVAPLKAYRGMIANIEIIDKAIVKITFVWVAGMDSPKGRPWTRFTPKGAGVRTLYLAATDPVIRVSKTSLRFVATSPETTNLAQLLPSEKFECTLHEAGGSNVAFRDEYDTYDPFA